MTVDLSPDAIRARQAQAASGGRHGGLTGLEMIKAADTVLKKAHRLQQRANDRRMRRGNRAAGKLDNQADATLLKAAVQIRIARACPLDKPYLHALTIQQVQAIQTEVERAYATLGSAQLAVQTHELINEQRARQRAEGAPA